MSAMGPLALGGRACVKECLATLLATLSLHASLCVILAVLRFKSFVGLSLEALDARAGDLMGKPLGQTALMMALCVERSSVLFAGLMLLA